MGRSWSRKDVNLNVSHEFMERQEVRRSRVSRTSGVSRNLGTMVWALPIKKILIIKMCSNLIFNFHIGTSLQQFAPSFYHLSDSGKNPKAHNLNPRRSFSVPVSPKHDDTLGKNHMLDGRSPSIGWIRNAPLVRFVHWTHNMFARLRVVAGCYAPL